MKKYWIGGLMMVAISCGCKKDGLVDNTGLIKTVTTGSLVNMSTDKAFYKPGDEVNFTLDKALPATVKVRYKQSGNIVQSVNLSGTSWKWIAPAADFTGYMVELFDGTDGKEKIYGTIAVDVSSDPARFPRNGFLSAYGKISDADIKTVISSLNRYHMNYVQFQDWEDKHHEPLAGTVTKPDASWKDIANRDNYQTTIKGYINAAHGYNMKTLHYNLAYGALNDAAADGVAESWYLFDDGSHTKKEVAALPQPMFKSDLNLMDPSNTGWQQYLAAKTNEAYQVYPFDGYQIDQLGNRDKTLYNYNGGTVDLPTAFNSFIKAMKMAMPTKALVMNAVTQYGQPQIASAPVDFLYSEVWSPNEGYKDLGDIIKSNDALTGGAKKSVLAAYMDYDLAGSPGYFNTPGVLFTDAVIFAHGGSHLELGEHMLGKEYFPNSNLQMRADLKAAMVSYYDFLTAYQNLLRDGGTFNNPSITAGDSKTTLNNFPPVKGQVSVIGKDLGSKQVIHLINFANATSLDWRDRNGTQTAPVPVTNGRFNFISAKTIKKIWVASPDIDGGASKIVTYTQSGNSVTFTLPMLKYWDMVVVEYQ
ncbi:glycoside hydrolase family 66 protein [Mucilaginibacter sp. OK283]|uniref:glycoside hydrolase family 66 protein n=1 Tax=Mucilaginibacter sp. OK283 TaxID=1881049 RepID=UPI0008CFCB78|nr:glycoside hydrolase family 66 protein [Mucilaginibacter sp. OK283]SEP40492.1 dextranase [Mucilaginibacter sp. OK283]